MNVVRALLIACLGLVATACTTLTQEPPGSTALPLARQWPEPGAVALVEYSDYWCAQGAAQRAERRSGLDPEIDRLELLLLAYCDLAHPDEPLATRNPEGVALAHWEPRATPVELIDYQQFWCERGARARNTRRESLALPADELELALLDYCDNARRAPRVVAARLEVISQHGPWPAGYAAWFALLQWHLQGFASASTEAAAQQQHMQKTIDQLRAIERDMSSRDTGGTGSMK